jgi:sugar phosphate isomerase/epimerase
MKFGICGDPEAARKAAMAGFDYFEWSVAGLLKPREEETAFDAALAEVRQTNFPCPAVNVFIPADLKITGPNANLAQLERFVTTACQRAHQAEVEIIVFGSGGARRIPDGFDRREAWQQVTAFCKMLAPIAASNGVTIAVEPLNKAECNILNTVSECAQLVKEIHHPAIRLLVDAYHLLKDNDSLQDVAANGSLLAHVHIATTDNRLAPGMETCDLQPFFNALVSSGYSGRVSIEAKLPDHVEGLQHLLEEIRRLSS